MLDGIDAVADVLNVGTQLRAGFDRDHVPLPEPVSVPWGELGNGQFQVFGGVDIGEGVEHLQQLGDVWEHCEPATATAGNGKFHLVDDLAFSPAFKTTFGYPPSEYRYSYRPA
ncbi:hypothetical protein [Paenarthrobacter aurescens]|uniref:hypothetical protein n=1 Tax=Paenarthrobacter aurescens TaxID=43663 RepID=UPI0021BFEC02|nr:hypothetical protein [Paenarthrobacter aurescens]MCT9870845.1 hypothetical protein [Paenarthrobacter aurescens]